MKDGKEATAMNDDRRRCDRQPALFLIARELCCTGMTDGFCSPSNAESCNCWIEAERFQRSTGLSANACVWVLKNRSRIEKEAARGVRVCRYTGEPGGACWREGKAVELCTCHGMSDEAFKASAAAHVAGVPAVSPAADPQRNEGGA